MNYEIKHRLTGAVLYTADIGDMADASRAAKLGAAVSLAVAAGANLAGANLAGANLAVADLAGAYLGGALGVIDAGSPDGWRCVGWMRDGVLRVRVGCRDKTLAEGRTYWADKPDRREVLAALDYVEAMARLRGWLDASAVPEIKEAE